MKTKQVVRKMSDYDSTPGIVTGKLVITVKEARKILEAGFDYLADKEVERLIRELMWFVAFIRRNKDVLEENNDIDNIKV